MDVSNQILALKPDQAFLLGDVCQGQGGEPAYKDWFDPSYGRIFRSSIDLTAIPGNHDRIADKHSRPFRKRFLGTTNLSQKTYFSQNLNKSWMLVALDDNPRYINEQNVWFHDLLRQNRRRQKPRQVVVGWHGPRFTIGGTSIGDNPKVNRWWNIFHNDPHTRILMHGHQHSFRHKTTRQGNAKYLRDIFIVGTGGGDKRRPHNRYGVLMLQLFDGGGFKASYRQIIKNYNQRIGGAQGKVMDTVQRPARRLKPVHRPGSGTSSPEVVVPDPPPPEPPPASNPNNPPPPEPPPSSIQPPAPPLDPSKRESYVEDGVRYVYL